MEVNGYLETLTKGLGRKTLDGVGESIHCINTLLSIRFWICLVFHDKRLTLIFGKMLKRKQKINSNMKFNFGGYWLKKFLLDCKYVYGTLTLHSLWVADPHSSYVSEMLPSGSGWQHGVGRKRAKAGSSGCCTRCQEILLCGHLRIMNQMNKQDQSSPPPPLFLVEHKSYPEYFKLMF